MGSTCTGFEVPFGGNGVGINSSQEAINVDAIMGENIDILALEEEVVLESKTSIDVATAINEDYNITMHENVGSIVQIGRKNKAKQHRYASKELPVKHTCSHKDKKLQCSTINMVDLRHFHRSF
ncbi:unnamed protein product [Euphydryas editha]|uniref:Uncharacterized protein n=1 Tax=Euphydryas editha TaxID=104508 RepID=A0AAU9USJ6_EUPED|nr:unnamed protein product [Euphydryas editha]